MTDKPTYEALEAQVSALTNEVSNLKQNQGDLYVLNDYLNTLHETTMDLLEKHDLNDLLTLQRYLLLFDKFNSRLRLCER